jgi:CrcB protein
MGSALGGILRYLVSELVTARVGAGFPIGTLAVNFLGSLLLGFLTELAAEHAAAEVAEAKVHAEAGVAAGELKSSLSPWHIYGWPFLMTGFCGGFTTFSTFSAQTFDLARGEAPHLAGWNVGLNLALCLVGVAIGYFLGRRFKG